MKRIAGILAYFVVCGSATHAVAQKNFTIQGRLTDPLHESQKVTLSYKKNGITKTDSTRVNKGRFELRGSISEPADATLWVGYGSGQHQYSPSQRFFIDTSIIRIESTSFETAHIKSGPAQRDFTELSGLLKSANDIRAKRMVDKVKATVKKDSLEMTRAARLIAEATAAVDSIEFAFIKSHPGSYISLFTLHQKTNPSVLANHKEQLANSAALLSAHLKRSELYEEIKTRFEFAEKLSVGKAAPDFSLKDTSGNSLSLSSFRGKYVLLDFWASWCLPCLFEMPNLVAAYEQFKDKNFEILGVSLDDQNFKQAWLKAINKYNLSWENVSDLLGSESPVVKLYGIYSIPMNYLIDPNGIIIATSLRGEEVSRKLSEVLTDNK